MILEIVILLFLIILSGVFSSAEIAMFSLSELKLRYLEDKQVPRAKLLRHLREDNHKLLITILIGNNLVNIGSASMATALALNVFGNNGVAIATGIMTLLILTFGEIIPKALATKHSISIALTMSPFLHFLSKLFFPLVFMFDKFTSTILPKNGSEEPLMTEEEVRGMVKMSEEEGSIKQQEEEMIQNIFKLDDTYAEDIMTPRPDIYALPNDVVVSDVVVDIKEKGYSRVPVYNGDLDTVIGALYAKDLLTADENQPITELIRPVFFVPETKRIDTLLREFKQKKMHMALVVNEHGTTVGLVTIEDLIEEIVGEIYDETDTIQDIKHPIKSIGDHHFIMEGRAEIEDVEDALKIKLDDDESSTISGFVMQKLNRVPDVGDVFQFKNYRFIVKQVNNQRIEKVEIIQKRPETPKD